jgi:hypothetical protein
VLDCSPTRRRWVCTSVRLLQGEIGNAERDFRDSLLYKSQNLYYGLVDLRVLSDKVPA